MIFGFSFKENRVREGVGSDVLLDSVLKVCSLLTNWIVSFGVLCEWGVRVGRACFEKKMFFVLNGGRFR